MMNDFDFERRPRPEHNHERPNHERPKPPEGNKKVRKVCEVNTSEDIAITVPVEVRADINTRDVKIECRGHEIIRERHCKPNVRKFKIRQKIHVCIPIDFIAECEIGEEQVDFDFHNA